MHDLPIFTITFLYNKNEVQQLVPKLFDIVSKLNIIQNRMLKKGKSEKEML